MEHLKQRDGLPLANAPLERLPVVHKKCSSRRAMVFLATVAAVITTLLQFGQLRISSPKWARSIDPPGGFDWFALEPSTEINWTPCFNGQKCARLLLPLDWTNPLDGRKTAIALRVLPAATESRGTVFINPGGPGGSGTNLVERAGANISRIVGGSFDVLGFDPRGTGASTPRADCFSSKAQRDIWETQEGHRLPNISDGTIAFFRAREQVTAARCEAQIGGEDGIARFMSTASVSRDMLEISQMLGQEKLHYWGFSYGSVLGQYFSAMYPDKVGRVVIDGVYDSHNYRDGLWDSNLRDSDEVINSLFTYCYQGGPLKCDLYEPTPEAIRERYLRVLSAVERNPIPVSLADPPILITSKVLMTQLFRGAYKPLAAYGTIIDTIRAIEDNNTKALVGLAPQLVSPAECKCASEATPWLAENDAFNAIACGDADAFEYDPDAFAAHYARLVKDSSRVGPFWAVHQLQCAEWRVRPAWRYTGPLAAPNGTAHPLLVVQPRWDPVCPLHDARAVRARYPGAGMVVQNSHGHCSLSAPSVCTARHVRAYFEDGVLPKEGTVCEADELPFVGLVGPVKAMSAEDAELFEAMRGLSSVVPTFGGI